MIKKQQVAELLKHYYGATDAVTESEDFKGIVDAVAHVISTLQKNINVVVPEYEDTSKASKDALEYFVYKHEPTGDATGWRKLLGEAIESEMAKMLEVEVSEQTEETEPDNKKERKSGKQTADNKK